MKLETKPQQKLSPFYLKKIKKHQAILDSLMTDFIFEIKGKTRRQVKVIFRRYTTKWKIFVAKENSEYPEIPLKPSAFEEAAKTYIYILPEPSLFTKLIKKLFNL